MEQGDPTNLDIEIPDITAEGFPDIEVDVAPPVDVATVSTAVQDLSTSKYVILALYVNYVSDLVFRIITALNAQVIIPQNNLIGKIDEKVISVV